MMIRRPAVAVALAALAVSLPAFAQTSRPQPGSMPAFDEVTKDMEAVPGLMTFYRYKTSDPTKDQTRILCAVPRSLLKQDLLFAVNYSRGRDAGFQYVDGLVRWEQVGRQLTLVTPDTRFVDKPGSPINDALRRTYRPSFLFSAPIVTLTPGGDPVVDLSDALFSPPVPVPGGRVRRDISRIDTVKSFPENTLIDIDYAVATGQGGSTIGLSYAFRRLPSPSEGYKPRVADERVGYFQTTRQDWTIKYDQREFVERFANRWDLRKKDPSLDLSPPEKPITFVIDKGVPYQWRKYVADGLLEWNKAFEKVGIVGAVVVQQQTDDNEFADADPADARYNFIQWTVRNQALAVGPSRADPRTGQILDADIVVDDAWIRYYNRNTAVFTPKPATATLGPGTVDFLRKNPQFLPPGVTADDLKPEPGELIQDSGTPDLNGAAKLPLRHSIGGDQCQLAVGMVAQLSLAGGVAAEAKAAGAPLKVSDEIIGQALKWVVMHEVGHTLGLRHNFKASSWLSLEEIRKKRDAGEAFVASVMDYAPLAFFPDDDLTKVKTFASDTIGPYDYWAIQYAYTQPKDGEPLAKTLKDLTSQSAKREYAYATDEDTMGLVSPDPLVNRYDLSDDPIAFARNQIALTDKLLANVADWAAKPDEPNYYLRQTFLQLTQERSRNLSFVSRLIGGQYFTRSRRADPGATAPLTFVPASTQRDALKLISETVLSKDFYKPGADLLARLTPSRFWDGEMSDDSMPSARIDFPYSRFVQSQYETPLMGLTSPETLQRVYDAEARTDTADKLTAAELIRSVRDTVWSELDAKPAKPATDAEPLIAAERRGMQNTHLSYLLAAADTGSTAGLSPDVVNQTRFALRELSEKIDSTLNTGGKSIDFATRGHLTEAKSKIDRTLNKPLAAAGSGNTTIIIQSGQKDAETAAAKAAAEATQTP